MEGTPFGRYRLLDLLGRGGMGEVWRAYDTETNNRTVAIKLLPPHLADDVAFAQRFRREADAAARLNNPHIIPIHTYGEIDGRLYVDMRLIEGHDLQQVLAQGPLPPGRAVRIIEQVAKALRAAHKVGLVHRDVKPSNILLDDDDFAYLIDFGIARAADDTRMTGTGNTIGTFQYMAPERLGGSPDDSRADIYALACVLYECLTGHPPFPGTNMASLVAAHLHTPPPQPSTARSDVPVQLDTVVATGMAKDPDQRYATIVELSTAARDAITARSSSPSTTTAPAAPPNPSPPTRASAPAPFATTVSKPVVESVIRQPETPEARGNDFRSELQQRTTNASRVVDPPTPPNLPPVGNRLSRRDPGPRRKTVFVLSAALVTVVAVVAVVSAALAGKSESPSSSSPPPHQSSSPSQATSSSAVPERQPVVLPFPAEISPMGVAVDGAGTVYVTQLFKDEVLVLASGATSSTVIRFPDLRNLDDVAVDSTGTLYLADSNNARLLIMAPGATSPTRLAVPGPENYDSPRGLAVDSAGNIYAAIWANNGNGKVLKFAAGSRSVTELPFGDLYKPMGTAVDSVGTVYVADYGKKRVLKLPAGATSPTELPLGVIGGPHGVAVDGAGAVYVTDGGQVLMLTPGQASPTKLPVIGERGIAISRNGTVYVAASNQVFAMPAG